MDSFAISGTILLTSKAITPRLIFRVSFHFALFQVALLLIGWYLGGLIGVHLNSYAEILAGSLLIAIGVKMIWESQSEQSEKSSKDLSRGLSLVMLAIATSIDALAVGGSLGLLKSMIFTPAVILAIATIFMSVSGLLIGRHFGRVLGVRAELIGGLVLIAMGAKIILI